jgi:hypothetical protein
MKSITITRERVKVLMEAFGNVGKVQINERDDEQTFRRFKYAAGRNYERCLAIVRATEKRIADSLSDDPEFRAYLQAREKVYADLADKDEKGNPVLKQEGEAMYYVLAPEKKTEAERQEAELKGRYELAIARQQAVADQAAAMWQETVPVQIMQVPFAEMPLNLLGGWVARISDMLEGAPEEEAVSST